VTNLAVGECLIPLPEQLSFILFPGSTRCSLCGGLRGRFLREKGIPLFLNRSLESS
jgi:hypothetical protein